MLMWGLSMFLRFGWDLAVVALVKMASEKEDKETFKNMLVYGGILSFLITLMSCSADPLLEAVMTGIYVGALYCIVDCRTYLSYKGHFLGGTKYPHC